MIGKAKVFVLRVVTRVTSSHCISHSACCFCPGTRRGHPSPDDRGVGPELINGGKGLSEMWGAARNWFLWAGLQKLDSISELEIEWNILTVFHPRDGDRWPCLSG
ncbi:hypothetical protein NPIL_297731 [Nephila pilipes]|uniref:Uncharacterized protein n=1 Tax=Nephila pilipes TaxID=299642 RepID=A0A8X6TWW3_NEPPI|nr:hypothetical protein NPIL_297731 [Nephila pilipes]